MRTIVLPPRFSPDSIVIWRAATRAGWTTARLSSWRVPDELHGSGAAIYGEPLFAHAIADTLGTALIEPPADWLTRIPSPFLGRNVRALPLGEALTLATPQFVKPAADKCFAAGVYPIGREIPNAAVLPPETPVLVADPVHWRAEYRCFVRERVCRTMSVYLIDGELACNPAGDWIQDDLRDQAARVFVQSVLADRSVELPPAVVLDVGEIDGFGWAVLETNAAWGSGIYGCDPHAALDVIDGACVAQAER